MSENNKRNSSKSARERAQLKRQAQLSAMRRNVTIFALLVLLVVGLVSTTFSSVLTAPNSGSNGSLVVDIKNNVVAQNNKSDLADTKANLDISDINANIPAGTKLYLKPNSNWTQANARFAAYFYGNGEAWVSMTAVEGESGIYECTSPAGKDYPNVIFCRMNPSATANNWNNKWNQTNDLTRSSTSVNMYTVKDGTWDKGGGSWSTYTPTPPPTDPPTEPPLSGNKKTIYVGVADHIISQNDNHKFTPDLHWWNDNNQDGNEDLVSLDRTMDFSVSGYWDGVAQTYHIYTVNVPVEATKYKLFNNNITNGSAWAKEEISNYEDGKIILYFHYTDYHNVLADYSNEVTAEFQDYAGNVIGDVQIITNGSTPTAPADSAVPTQNGYKFTGWDPEVGPITVNTTYTAQYDPIEYTITYDNDGGTCSASLIKKYTIESEIITLPDDSKMTKIGYVFDGWYENGVKVTSIPKGSTGNRNFKANWIETNYNLTIKNGGEISASLIEVKANENKVNPTNNVYVIPHGSKVTVSINRANNTFFEYVKLGTSNDKVNYNADYSKTINSVTSNYTFEYKLSAYKNFTLSRVELVDDYNGADDTLSYRVGDSTDAIALGVPTQISYNNTTKIYVPAPQGYYAKIYYSKDGDPLGDPDVTYTTVEENNTAVTTASFDVTVLSQDVNYYVGYFKYPTITVEQPQYGSIYITSGTGNNIKYYINGQTVYAGTDLTVNVIPDNTHCTIENVYAHIDGVDNVISKHNNKYTFNIFDDTVIKSDITVKRTAYDENFSFEEQGADGTTYIKTCEPGKRRIFFTENSYWGDGDVICHYAQTNDDTDMSKNNVTMTYKYTKTQNSQKQRVYYADIPANMQYVKFIYSGDESKNTAYKEIDFTEDSNKLYSNAFYIVSSSSNAALTHWTVKYSDYLALDREYTSQQAVIKLGDTAEFEYSHDYPGATLDISREYGNGFEWSYDSGMLEIKPKDEGYKFSLVKVTSKATGSVKYYLIKLSALTGKPDEIQKIFPLNTHITLSGVFNSKLLTSLQYNVSATNFPYKDAYRELTDFDENPVENSDKNTPYSVTIKECFNGVQYFKITANDSLGDVTSFVQKTSFGTDNVVGSKRMVYLKALDDSKMSKYKVRACFESTSGKSWVTLQKLDGTNYYRANVPSDYNYKVSFYLTHKQRYANIKSNEKDFKYICYYYAENIVLPENDSYNPIYEIKELYSDRTMLLELQ